MWLIKSPPLDDFNGKFVGMYTIYILIMVVGALGKCYLPRSLARKGASCINAKSNEKGKRKPTIPFRLDYEINKLNSGNRTGSLRGNLIIEKKKNQFKAFEI